MDNIASKSFNLFYFKFGCLLFWSCWFVIACTTNVFDFLHAMDLVPSAWAFRSGNYTLLGNVLSIYHTPGYILNLLFICDIFAQGLSALLFFLAAVSFLLRREAWALINTAFAVSMALWAVFLIMEEVFLAYLFEPAHIRLFAFEMLTLLAIHLLP